MRKPVAALLLAFAIFVSIVTAHAAGAPEIVWRDNDDQPIAEPAKDEEGDYIWWDGIYNMAVHPLTRLADLGADARTLAEWVNLVDPPEATNVNALDEVPDSTWFTNRHARRRLSAAELERGALPGKPPAADGPLVILSGKSLGITPGFVMRDANGDRFIVKFDPTRYPEMATGAELVCSRIVWALGWNVPDNQLFVFRPERLQIAEDATARGEYNRKVKFTKELLAKQLEGAYHLPDGQVRTVASRLVPGEPKGSPRLVGTRPDDPNDTVPHEDRRDMRGLRVVAAFLSYTDARRGNLLDTFVPDSPQKGSPGHLVHYVLDFSSALGAGNNELKSQKYGHQYLFDPLKDIPRFLLLGAFEPAWASLPITHPALGYFESSLFDPEAWRTSYRNLIFDQATVRDGFWGAKLVTSLSDTDLRIAVKAGAWSDPRAEELLFQILAERRRRIARVYFDPAHINPIDRFTVRGDELEFADLAVVAGVVDPSAVRFRCGRPDQSSIVVSEPRCPIEEVLRQAPEGRDAKLQIETSHDVGEHWSPPTIVRLAGAGGSRQVAEIERATR